MSRTKRVFKRERAEKGKEKRSKEKRSMRGKREKGSQHTSTLLQVMFALEHLD
jgi:hypothetical protein